MNNSQNIEENSHGFRAITIKYIWVYTLLPGVIALATYKYFLEEMVVAFILMILFGIGGILHFRRLYTTKSVVKVVLLMLVILAYMSLTYGQATLITYIEPEIIYSALVTDMFLTSAIVFSLFLIGYHYSLLTKKPLRFFSPVLLYQWIGVVLYFTVQSGFSPGNMLEIGAYTVIFLPYMVYSLGDESPKARLVLVFGAMFYLLLISARASLLGIITFTFTFYFYHILTKSKFIYNLYYWMILITLFSAIIIYVSGGLDFLEDQSLATFGKSLNSGRKLMWIDLAIYFSEEPWFGYGINQQTANWVSSYAKNRPLSSHNMYIEVLIRGGVVLFGLVLILFFLIWRSLYTKKHSLLGKCVASGFAALLVMSGGFQLGLDNNIVYNSLLWLIWGIGAGEVWKVNNRNLNSKTALT